MCELKLHVRVPMDAWRQWIRHRTAKVNEYQHPLFRWPSTPPSAPPRTSGACRPQNNKQGSDGVADPDLGARLSAEEAELQDRIRAVYNGRLEAGVAREQARKDLPLCTYTEAYWKIDLHNLLHFLALRMDPHAQQEIRDYADVIGREIVARWVPLVWEAFEDYRLGASFFSRIEGEILAALGAGDRRAGAGPRRRGRLAQGVEERRLDAPPRAPGIRSQAGAAEPGRALVKDSRGPPDPPAPRPPAGRPRTRT